MKNYSKRIQQDNRFRFWISLSAFLIALLLTARGPTENMLQATLLFLAYSVVFGLSHFLSKTKPVSPLLQYALLSADVLAITAAVYLTGAEKSPLYVLYIVLFGICIYHEALSNFVFAVVLTFCLYSGLLLNVMPKRSDEFLMLAGQLILMGVLTGVLTAVLIMMAKDRRAKGKLVARARTMAQIVDVLGGSMVNAREKVKTIILLIDECFNNDGLQCHIDVHKAEQQFLPPHGGKNGVQIPIMVGETIFGTLSVTRKGKGRALTTEEHDYFSSIAHSLGVALHRDKLWEDLQIQLETVEASLLVNLSNLTQVPGATQDPTVERQAIENMLEMVRMERGRWRVEKELCAWDDLIKEAFGNARKMSGGKNPSLKWEKETGDLPSFRADPAKVLKALANLLHYALKVTPAGQDVVVTARENPGEVAIRIQDQGPGLTATQVAALFDEPQETENVQPAEPANKEDLGFYLCKKIVKAHGGRLWAETRGEGGNTIAFAIPIETAPTPAPQEAAASV